MGKWVKKVIKFFDLSACGSLACLRAPHRQAQAGRIRELFPKKFSKRYTFSQKVGLIFFLGLLWRLSIWILWNPVISRDSIHYLQMASHFFQGRWMEGLHGPYPPAYPFMVSLFLKLQFPLIMAGRMASLIGYGLAFFSLFFLFQTWKPEWTLPSLLLLAVQPYHMRYSIMVLSESLFIGFFLAALVAYFIGIHKKQGFYFSLASFFALFAYLTRPEGFLLVPLFIFFIFWIPQRRILEKGKYLLFLLLPFFFLFSPYLIFLKSRPIPSLAKSARTWKLTQKGGLFLGLRGTLLKKEERTGLYRWDLSPSTFWKFFKVWLKRWFFNFFRLWEIGHPLLMFLAGLSLVHLGSIYQKKGASLEIFFILFLMSLVVCQISLISVARVSSRLVLQPGCTSLLLAPMGLKYVWEKVLNFKKANLLLLSLLLLSTLPIGLRPLGIDKTYLRIGGLWIKEKYPQKKILVVSDARLGFYAQKPYTLVSPLVSSSPQKLKKRLKKLWLRWGKEKEYLLALEILYPQKIIKKTGKWKVEKSLRGKKYTLWILSTLK